MDIDDLPTCDGCRCEVQQVERCEYCEHEYCPACYDNWRFHRESDCEYYAREDAEIERHPYSSRGLSLGDFWRELG